jgi:hypothetical protein
VSLEKEKDRDHDLIEKKEGRFLIIADHRIEIRKIEKNTLNIVKVNMIDENNDFNFY